jgi:hypothetical protein
LCDDYSDMKNSSHAFLCALCVLCVETPGVCL